MLHPKNRKLTILATATGLVVVVVSLGIWMLASRGGQVDTASGPGTPSTVLASTTRASPITVSGMDPADALLDPARQKYIWDAEHVTHMMEWRFGTKFRAALVARDERQLLEFFRSPFQGLVLDLQQCDVHTKGPVSRRTYSAGSAPQRVAAAKLVTWLIDVLSEFASIDSTSLRVLQISQAGEQNDSWVMQLLVTARGTSDTGTLLALDSTHRVRCLWTHEGEIGSGPIIAEWNVEACSLRSCPRRLMEEVTERTGLSRLPLEDNWKLTDKVPLKLRFQMAVEDFDRDGYLDIALSDVNGRMILLHSVRGQRFVEATRSLGLPLVSRRRYSSFSLGWIDYDNDGFPDLLMGGRIYHNQDGRRFQDGEQEKPWGAPGQTAKTWSRII